MKQARATKKLDEVMKMTLFPNLSMIMPRMGERTADIKYGTLYKTPAVVELKPNYSCKSILIH